MVSKLDPAKAFADTTPGLYSAVEHVNTITKSMPSRIKVSDLIPNTRLSLNPETTFTTRYAVSGKLVVVFTVPKAFTKTCSEKHLPGFILCAEKLKKLGVDKIICVAVNTNEELSAWDKMTVADLRAQGKWTSPSERSSIEYWADWGGEFINRLGLGVDKGEPRGLGFVARRSAMVFQDGILLDIAIEETAEGKCNAKECTVSSAGRTCQRVAELLGIKIEGPKDTDEKKAQEIA